MRLKHPEDYYIKLLLQKVKVEEIMTRQVVYADSHMPLSAVSEKIRLFGIRHVPVINPEREVVGIISERDLFRIQSPRRLEDGSWYYDKQALDTIILKDVMTYHPVTLHPENSLSEVIVLMVERKFGCVPIVDARNKLCGIITQMDILKVALEILKEQ